jgi:hypothetical protein
LPRSNKQDEVKTEFSWKRAAIQRRLEHESRGIAVVGTVTRQLLILVIKLFLFIKYVSSI